MRKFYLPLSFGCFILSLLSFTGAVKADTVPAIADSTEKSVSLSDVFKPVINETDQAKDEVDAAQKELQIHQKAVDIEKQNVEVILKETEAAKKEIEILKDAANQGSRQDMPQIKEQLKEATEQLKQKKKDVLIAQEKVKVAEEKMLAAQEKAGLAEEKLALAQRRANIAEEKNREKYTVIQKKVIRTLIIIIIGYLTLVLLVKIINRRISAVKTRHLIRKSIVYFITLIIILFIFFVWIQNINSLTIFFSIIGAGVALALQEVLLCIAGWFLILVRRPFEIGDRIELGGIKGDVIDIRLFQTALLEVGNWVEADQSTGRIVNIPNSAVFKGENYNYSQGFEFIWNEIKIVITFESDWKKAEKIMLAHSAKESKEIEPIVKQKINAMARHYMIYYEHLTPIVYINIKDSGVELSLRYLTQAQRRRMTHDRLCRAILASFRKEETINFAYTTYRIVK